MPGLNPTNEELKQAWPVLKKQLPTDWEGYNGAQALQALGFTAHQLATAEAIKSAPNTALKDGQSLFVKQAGVAIMLGAVDVHPMQPLETAYQGIVRRAGERAPDADQARAQRQAELDKFFRFAILRLSTMPPTPADSDDPPLLSDKLWLGKRCLKMASRYVKALQAGASTPPDAVNQVKGSLQRSRLVGESCLQEFRDVKTAMTLQRLLTGREPGIPMLTRAENDFENAQTQIERIRALPADFAPPSQLLKDGYKNLDQAADGLSTVQALFFIDTFYLYRLLVRFRLEAPRQLTDEDQRIVSDKLTGVLHAPSPAEAEAGTSWIASYFKWAMVDLGNAVVAAAPDHVIFYLKGGRAVEYFLGTPQNGKNDWDTQIVINPGLPAREWYAVFDRVHNVVVERLEKYRRGFLFMLQANAQTLLQTVEQALVPPENEPEAAEPEAREEEQAVMEQADQGLEATDVHDEDPDPPVLARYTKSCKAELIDVGMPRRDTVECLEQWRLLHANILQTEGVRCPGPLYFSNDFIFMLREVIAGNSRSAAKAKKRLSRLGRVLASWGDGNVWDERTLAFLNAVCPKSCAMLRDLVPQQVRNLGWIALDQFAVAYDLEWAACPGADLANPTLAAVFDDIFTATFSGARRPAGWNQAMQQAYDSLDNQTDQALFYALGSMGTISNAMEAHFAVRAEQLQIITPNSPVMQLVQQIAAEPLLQRASRNELRLGIAGGLAAALQAQDAADGGQPAQRTEPVIRADLRVYSANEMARGGVVMDIVESMVQNLNLVTFDVVPRQNGDQNWLAIKETHAINFGGGFDYAPTVLVIAAEPQEGGWPLLNSVEEVPVLSPRDLALEYRRRMGHVDEYAARQRLKKSEEAVVDILTNYESPPRPAV